MLKLASGDIADAIAFWYELIALKLISYLKSLEFLVQNTCDLK
jgi:hypothetical protein